MKKLKLQLLINNNTINSSLLLHKFFHTNSSLAKYVTNTELMHRFVLYGRSAYPKRPNDPRVPSNPKFGQTYLDSKPQKQHPELISLDDENDQMISSSQKQNSKISKAMKVYLERASEQNKFLSEQKDEYENGRRHLANMMGLNMDTMNSEDIDKAIKYLMPSGLFDPRARPRMKPPTEIYPAIKQAQFSADGRPYHSMFFTGRANFYQTCFELEQQMKRLSDYECDQLRKNITNPPKDSKVDLSSSEWLSASEMKTIFLEKLEDSKYESLIVALNHLANHPYSKLCEDFIMKFRKKITAAIEIKEIPPLMYDDNGRPFMTAVGRRKLCVAYVTVRGNGTGKVDINGQDILYFDFIQDREQIMTPLKFCGLLGKVDIECQTKHLEFTREYSEDAPPFQDVNKIRELGTSSQSGAIRYALAMALRSFVDNDTVEKMRSVGLLSADLRVKLRKIWGQEGARRKYTWKKR